jgi:hypothetical protein
MLFRLELGDTRWAASKPDIVGIFTLITITSGSIQQDLNVFPTLDTF